MREFGVTVFEHQGRKYSIFRERVKNMMAHDGKGNPALWFIHDMNANDYPVCGVSTKREALDFIGIPEDHVIR